MNSQINRHHLNAEGRFWIDKDVCLACSACEEESPNNIKYDSKTGTSYIFKQPENELELQQVRNAVMCCCVEAIIED